MTARDAGVRATIRAAVGQRRHAPVGRRVLAVEAERRIGIEETVGQQTDMERAPEMSEHRSQPLCIYDAARQIAEFIADPCELVPQSRRGWSRWRQSALDRFLVMLDHIVELAERAFMLDLAAKARWTGAGIPLEHGDRGMLVLNLARHRAERPIGDVPGERPSKLTGCDPPWTTICMRDRRTLGRARVEMIAQSVDKAYDAAAQFGSIVGRREHLPDGVDAACRPLLRGQALHHVDCARHGCDRHPLGFLAAYFPRLIGDAFDAMSLDNPVGASSERPAADAHRLQFAIAHA